MLYIVNYCKYVNTRWIFLHIWFNKSEEFKKVDKTQYLYLSMKISGTTLIMGDLIICVDSDEKLIIHESQDMYHLD